MAGYDKIFREKKPVRTPEAHVKTVDVKREGSQAAWKSSEAQLLAKVPNQNERKSVTGYEGKPSGRSEREVLRLESSYGNIAFGENDRRGLTVMISEKRRHNSPTIDREKKLLREFSEFEKPLGRGKVVSHNEGSAVAFRYQNDATKNEVISGIKEHIAGGGRSAANQVTPFFDSHRQDFTKEEHDKKRQAENDFSLKLRDAMDKVKSAPEGGKIKEDLNGMINTALILAKRKAEKGKEKDCKKTGEDEPFNTSELEDEKSGVEN